MPVFVRHLRYSFTNFNTKTDIDIKLRERICESKTIPTQLSAVLPRKCWRFR